jgi:spore coat protein A
MKPDETERGWKDTVRVHPGQVTRIIARFEPYTGNFPWHCHILEHEDNDMMRPFTVISK